MFKTHLMTRAGKYQIETRTEDDVLFAIMTADTLTEAKELQARLTAAMQVGIDEREGR